jgi:hypothetical protein
MEERSLRISGANTTFFNKISNTLTKMITPTKEGINSLIISSKRNNLLKVYELFNEKEIDEEELEKKYEEVYTTYLETLDKYVLNSIYRKASNGTATEFQRKALSQYYGIVQLKENEYIEYKYRKQKYLLELDNENVRIQNKEKLTNKYRKFYISKMDELYKRILKNYSIKLADNISQYDSSKEFIYTKVFITLEEYIKNILCLKKDNKEYVELYEKFEKFLVGKLDNRDNIEKNMILLEISRKLFTHSLPLVVAEQCYLKLLKDARCLVQDSKIAAKRERAYEMLINLIEDYNIRLLSTKVYWDNLKEREEFKNFFDKFKEIEKQKDIDFENYMKEKEILFIKNDLKKLCKEKQDYTTLTKYYKRRLVDYGAMRELKNSAVGNYKNINTLKGEKIKSKVKCTR